MTKLAPLILPAHLFHAETKPQLPSKGRFEIVKSVLGLFLEHNMTLGMHQISIPCLPPAATVEVATCCSFILGKSTWGCFS